MFSLAIIVLITVATFLVAVHISQRTSSTCRRAIKIFPGPKLLPIIGNGHLFGSSEDSFRMIQSLSKQYDRCFRVFIGGMVFILLKTFQDIEVVLSTSAKLEKNETYRYLHPWLGTGLLTAAGEKWKSRRKIITPAFHFKILESYIDVFNANGAILCEKLAEKLGKGTFDVLPLIRLYALDNIYETAMKSKVNAQINSDSEYVKAVRDIAMVIIARSFSFLLQNDWFFLFSKCAKIQRDALRVLHGTTKNLIKERRLELEEEKKRKGSESQSDNCNFDADFNSPPPPPRENDSFRTLDEKKRLVFLDILLSSKEGTILSDEDICEEVSTFMFEGHDTVSSGISFTLYALAHNPKVQEIAYQEQVSIFGNDDRHPTSADLQNMRYLDMVLKESQRLYPSVPLIGRKAHEDVKLKDGYVIPKGCQITLVISELHKDPNVWPDPETFNPDNFLPEAVSKRNPYSYIPFSAGERNCIGQRFALLEMKSCLSKILRRFKLLPSMNREDDANLYAELVLMSTTGVNIQVEERK